MLYLVALILPPLALLLCGKPVQAVISAIVWVLSWIFAIIGGLGFIMWVILAVHAIMVVRDRNTKKMLESMRDDAA